MSNTIYIISNIINDKVYIGQTSRPIESREKEHFYYYKTIDTHIYRAMRKYGVENFNMTPICSVFNVDDLDDLEIQIISEYDSFHNGYNMNEGGNSMRGYKHTVETKKKMSMKRMGRLCSDETKKKMSKLSSGKNNAFYNKQHTEETKKSIGKLNFGKNNSKFKGYYIIPFYPFKLESSRQIKKYTNSIHPQSILNWCKNSNKIISNVSVNQSPYLKEDMMGKTFKDIGFDFSL